MNAIRPFTLDIPEADLADLAARLDRTRWPEAATVDDWTQGTPLAALGELVAYWRTGYDWRRCEARLNAVGQFVTEIDGLDIHFLHKPSSRSDAVPLLLTHGWPGSAVAAARRFWARSKTSSQPPPPRSAACNRAHWPKGRRAKTW